MRNEALNIIFVPNRRQLIFFGYCFFVLKKTEKMLGTMLKLRSEESISFFQFLITKSWKFCVLYLECHVIKLQKKLILNFFQFFLRNRQSLKDSCYIWTMLLKVTFATKQYILKMCHEAQVKNFFYFVEKLCSILKIFKFLYFWPSHDLPNLWHHDEY